MNKENAGPIHSEVLFSRKENEMMPFTGKEVEMEIMSGN